MCEAGFKYYRCKEGYLCGGGHHFCPHADVDNMMKYGTTPKITYVNNILNPRSRWIAPPADGWHEIFHESPAQWIAQGDCPLPLRYDGTAWDLRPFEREIEMLRQEYCLEWQVAGGPPEDVVM